MLPGFAVCPSGNTSIYIMRSTKEWLIGIEWKTRAGGGLEGVAHHSATLLTTKFETEDHANNISKTVQGVGDNSVYCATGAYFSHTSYIVDLSRKYVLECDSASVVSFQYMNLSGGPLTTRYSVMPRYSRVRTSRFRKFAGPTLQ
jgi:hypothetical protein